MAKVQIILDSVEVNDIIARRLRKSGNARNASYNDVRIEVLRFGKWLVPNAPFRVVVDTYANPAESE